MAKKSKLELLMVLSDKLFNSKLDQVQNKLSGATSKMDSKMSKFSGKQIKLAAGVAGAFAAIGGIALLTAGFNKGIEATEKFDSAFLPIKQLNLDKSKSEMDSYRSLIRDSAYEVGTSLEDSTNAFYDLQSATGLYGKEAESVFKKVGKYSIATGANLGDAMNSTTKAMKAFGMGVDDIDDLLTSNAKAVQAGITTFDQLATVQTQFGGAASAAGQGIDVANKMFAVFTSIGGGAAEAATLTKTFFQGLTQQASKIKDELDIEVYDGENLKDADKLLAEISDKFKTMNRNDIDAVINKIGGPEGLRAALGKVKTGAEDMISTFNNFDSSSFNLEDALKNAEGDIGTLKNMFGNRLEIIFSKIGEKVLPILLRFFEKINPALEWLYQNIDWLMPAIGSFIGILGLGTAAVWLWNAAWAANPIGLIIIGIAALVALIATIITKWDEWGAALTLFMGPVGVLIGAFKSIYDHWESIKTAFQTDGIIGGLKRIGIVLLDALLKPIQQLLELVAKIPGMGGIAGSGAKMIEDLRANLDLVTPGEKEAKAKTGETVDKKVESLTKSPKGKTDGTTDDKKHGETVNKVASQANQVRNVTIKIDSFNKGGINVAQSAYSGMTQDDVEAWFKDMMRRVVINAETI